MTAPLALTALALLAARPAVQSVVLEPGESRPTLTVTASGPLPAADVVRTDSGLTLTWDATMEVGAPSPAPRPPLKAVRLLERGGRVSLEVAVDAAVPHAIEADGPRVRVRFGASAAAAPDVAALWATLFPAVSEPDPLPPPSPETETAGGGGATGDREDGLPVGPALLRPAVEVVYVAADSTFVSPQPVHDEYFEIRPRLGVESPLGAGAVRADYEARLRRGSAFEEVDEPSHLVNAGLEFPVGTRLVLRASEHYATGTLETREVDPGGEYFFGLGRYRRNRFGVEAQVRGAGRFGLEAAALWDDLDVDEQANFFDYEQRTLVARLGYELGPRLTGFVSAAHEHIPPPPERPIAETSARTLGLELRGELGPRTRTEIAMGLRDQDTPRAAPAGREFRGLVLGARVRQELGPESTLQLAASRASFPSAFEANAFYLSHSVLAELDVPAPASFVLRLAAGYHWNDYRTRALGLGEPRRDRIWDGAIGLSRPLTRLAWVRADYRRERRDSNLDSFDVRTWVFAAQVGIGFTGGPTR